jgi:replicative DNA helicase
MKQKTNAAFSVLGLLAYQPAYMAEIADTLRPEMFGSSLIVDIAAELWQSHERRLPMTAADIRDIAPELAEQILAHPIPPDRLTQAAERIKSAWEARQLSDIYKEAQDIAKKGDPLAARQHVEAQTEILMNSTARPDEKITQIHHSIAHMERYFQTGEGKRVTGIDTGFPYLNRQTNGWQRGDINVIAAKPGKGKTTVTLQSALAAAKMGNPALYFSCGDMTAEQLYLKAACILADIDIQRVMANTVTAAEKTALGRAYEEIADIPFEVIDRKGFAGTTGSTRDIARRKALLWQDTGLIVIDYVQQLRANWVIRDPVERLTQVSSDIKDIAVMLDCGMLEVSQLSRDFAKSPGRRPDNSDLRGSGALEQDASRIFFVDVIGEEDVLHFTKCRHGSLRGNAPIDVSMTWRADIGRYEWVFDSFTPIATAPVNYTDSPFPAPVTSAAMVAGRPDTDEVPF